MKLIAFLLLLICCHFVHGTLSKSSPKSGDHVENERKKLGKKSEKKKESVLMQTAQHLFDEATQKDILNTYSHVDVGPAKLDVIKLGYVTPWNHKGKIISKWAAQKFTHLSPTWFEFVPTFVNNEATCEVIGHHDVDKQWMEDVPKNNTEIKFFPRFALKFNDKDMKANNHLVFSKEGQTRCADEIVRNIKDYGFPGIVLEMFEALHYAGMNGEIGNAHFIFTYTVQFALSSANLQSVLVIEPFIHYRGLSLEHDMLNDLLASTYYVNLMFYDYRGGDGFSPYTWIKQHLDYIEKHFPSMMSKVLVGLPYYGFCNGRTNDMHPFDGKVVEMLKQGSELLYNNKTRENYIINETAHSTCYIPTKRFLQERLDFVSSYEIGGFAFWELGQGFNHFTDLL